MRHRPVKRKQFKKKGNEQLQLEFVEIREILDHLNIPYSESGKNVSTGWVGVQCPFPGCDDHSNHLGINLTTPIVSCYNCGKTGNYLKYLAAEVNSWGKAKELIKQFTPRELRQNANFEQTENQIYHVNLPDDAVKILPQEHRTFLERRGFNPDSLDELYNFHYCDQYSEWSNRIIVPIYRRNKLITFTSISIEDDPGIRYIHLKKEESIIHCKNYLLGLEHVMGRTVIVVEGFFDMARIGPGCVCAFGTKITHEQKLLLSKFDKVIIVFDGDSAGIKNGRKLANEIAAFVETELITLDEGLDPDKLSIEDINELKQMIKVRW